MKKLIIFKMVVICFLFTYCAPDTQSKQEKPSKKIHNIKETERNCFLMVYTYISEIEDQQETLRDSSYLTYTIKNGQISGVYKWLPAEKDHKVGVFEGTITKDTADVVYSYFAEGEKGTEELMFIVTKGGVKIGQGEGEFEGNLYKYKNKKDVKFIEFIPKVDCSIIK